jgi:hypothetical protein
MILESNSTPGQTGNGPRRGRGAGGAKLPACVNKSRAKARVRNSHDRRFAHTAPRTARGAQPLLHRRMTRGIAAPSCEKLFEALDFVYEAKRLLESRQTGAFAVSR